MAPFLFLTFTSLLAICSQACAQSLNSSLLGNAAQPLHLNHEGCIHMPILHSTNQKVFGKRAVSIELASRSDVAYYARLDIGSPPQASFVQLDTGSFELWVNPQCDNLGSAADQRFCYMVGQYDSSSSSTARQLEQTNTLRYGIGTANVSYVTDDIILVGTARPLQGVQFGVATATTDAFSGILGIGYGQGRTLNYPNFVDELAAQNATRGRVFTVALGSKDEEEGVIVFGGVDMMKFSGSLARLPIIPARDSPDKVPRYWVQLESLSLTPPSGRSMTYDNTSLAVFLDSGATLTLMPADLVARVAADFGSTEAAVSGFYEVDCNLVDLPGTMDFAFDGVTIRVSYRELIRMLPTSPPVCYLGITPNEDFVLLGDTFMRSAYVVFDQDNDVVWMTQYTNCGDAPSAITDASAIGSLKGMCKGPQAAVDSSSSIEAGSSSSGDLGAPTTTQTSSNGAIASSNANAGASSSAEKDFRALCLVLGMVIVYVLVA